MALSDPEQWDSADVATAIGTRAPDLGDDEACALVVVEGPDTGKRFFIGPEDPLPAYVGTGPSCAIRLTDREVSRRHAALDLVDGRLRIRDLESTNGVWIQGVGIFDASVDIGTQIRVGQSVLSVEAAEAPGSTAEARSSFGRFLGSSALIQRLYPVFDRLAASDIPIVIEGETGTGKEVLAEALHEQGARRAEPYVVFDCTQVPANLMEAELFGHERGAFTGAGGARAGYFEQAHRGTLLIDEIGDLELALQPKLLRAIERHEFRRVGSERSVKVDVRVIAATRRNLEAMVQEGRFRDDLYHRLAVARVELPPLRRRRGDISVLARQFWRELGGNPGELRSELLALWESESWSGNVRELRNTIVRRIALGELAATLTQPKPTQPGVADFMQQVIARGVPLPLARREVIEEFERRYCEALLARHGGNVSHAAAAASITRRYFQKVRARSSE
jgi:two-component system, NtrC family, response regulator HydG